MKRIRVSQLQPGMRLGRSIISAEGQVLLHAGVELRPQYIERLSRLGYDSVYVQDPECEDLEVAEVVPEAVRREAVRNLREAFLQLKRTRVLDYRLLSGPVRGIVDGVLENPHVLIHLQDVRSHDDYTFVHSVNVGIMCALIGRRLGYNVRKIHELTVGGLLHDIGKIEVPREILNKRGPLTTEEMAVIRRHPKVGFDILRRQGELSVFVAHMAYQHHEALDGSGYPRGLRGDDIHEFGLITAVADAFDALTADRPYRKALTPAEALETIMNGVGTRYDARVVQALRAHIAPYPLTSRVRLNTGEVGIVVGVEPPYPDRPAVRIVSRDGRRLDPPYPLVKLWEREDLEIVALEE